jgi:hypothetical protein
MTIDFERTGGFAGARLATTIHSEDLPAEEEGQLRDLIAAADFFQQPATSPGRAPGADRFQYKVSVEGDGRRHTIQVNEGAIPPELRPLLQWLTKVARQGPRK